MQKKNSTILIQLVTTPEKMLLTIYTNVISIIPKKIVIVILNPTNITK